VGNGSGPLTLPPGRHELSVVNSELGVRTSVVAQVSSGKSTAVNVQVPTGALSVNALPWADVWLDGEKIGETPIGNLQVRVGTHDVVFRNPDLGERHVTTVVTAREPTRLSVDLRAR
jgi:serine/threonine-protein kinase